VRHALVLFGGIVPRKATAQLREQLAEAEAALTEAGKDPSALFSIAAVSAKLALTEWLVNRSWRAFLNENAQKKIAGSFKRFADIQLSRAAAELKMRSSRRGGRLRRPAAASGPRHRLHSAACRRLCRCCGLLAGELAGSPSRY
jgi:inorganic triphosphatase YgiF